MIPVEACSSPAPPPKDGQASRVHAVTVLSLYSEPDSAYKTPREKSYLSRLIDKGFRDPGAQWQLGADYLSDGFPSPSTQVAGCPPEPRVALEDS